MAGSANAASTYDERPRQGRVPGPVQRWLRVGVVVAGTVLALTCVGGPAFAAAPDSAWAAISVAAKTEKPGRGQPAREDTEAETHGNSRAERHGNGRAEARAHAEHPGNGAGLGRLVRGGLTDEQADDLAAELRSCLADDTVREMRLGQLQRLAHAAGLSTEELKDLLDDDDDSHPGHGLGRLVRGGLADNQADDVARELRKRLEAGDLKDVRLGELLQAAHACGITPREFRDLLD